jgi:hypothetical protein
MLVWRLRSGLALRLRRRSGGEMTVRDDLYHIDDILSEFRNAFFCVSLFYSSIFGFIISNAIDLEKFDGIQYINFASFLISISGAFWLFLESCEFRYYGDYMWKAVVGCIFAASISGLNLYISTVISNETKPLIGLVLLCWAFSAMFIASAKSRKKNLRLKGKAQND